MNKITVLLCALLMPLMASAQEVKSPNGQVAVKFYLESGRPTYEMSYKNRAVVKPSHLGLELAKDKHASKGMRETSLMDGFEIKDTKTSTFDETWKPVWGEVASIRNHYNELAVTLDQPATKREMIIRFRVYDEGMGLRYEFPQQDSLVYFVIKDEHTQFAMTGDHTAWWLLATTTRRSRRRRSRNSLRFARASTMPSTGATLPSLSSPPPVCRRPCS